MCAFVLLWAAAKGLNPLLLALISASLKDPGLKGPGPRGIGSTAAVLLRVCLGGKLSIELGVAFFLLPSTCCTVDAIVGIALFFRGRTIPIGRVSVVAGLVRAPLPFPGPAFCGLPRVFGFGFKIYSLFQGPSQFL
jgi:hypothetical protein